MACTHSSLKTVLCNTALQELHNMLPNSLKIIFSTLLHDVDFSCNIVALKIISWSCNITLNCGRAASNIFRTSPLWAAFCWNKRFVNPTRLTAKMFLNSVYISCGFFVSIKNPWWWQKKNSITNFLHGVLCVKILEKLLPVHPLTERWEAGNYHIIFWSKMAKAEFSSEIPDQFLNICSIHVAPTHLATIFYKKMEDIQKQDWSLWIKPFIIKPTFRAKACSPEITC